MRIICIIIGACAALGIFAAAPVSAQTVGEQKPLFEVGVFGIGGYLPDYPGSKQNHFHFLPLPFLVYRSQYFRSDPQAVRGVFFDQPDFNFDISASGSFNTTSSDKARAGMPGLDDLGEIGPRLNVILARDQRFARLELEVPARAVFSTDFKSISYRGWRFAPEIAYIHDNFFNTGGRFKLGIDAEFATEELMSYFYSVAPAFATPTRAAYAAGAGYLGAGLDASYRIPLNSRMTLYTLVAGNYYGGATNAASPLLQSKFNFTAGLGLSFSLYRSDDTVSAHDFQ